MRDAVVLAGHLSDEEVAVMYTLCDVFTLPTGQDKRGQVEGFGLVFTEAHAYGKPVVAGRSGGVIDAVLHGETGFVVEPGNEQELSRAILRLLDDRDLAAKFGAAGKARVESELNWITFTRRIMDTLEKSDA